MRKSANATIVLTALFATVGLWIASTFAAALAFGAIALIVPGTGTHNIGTVEGYKENAADRFINPSGVPCTSTDGCQLLGVDYPASFWPIPLPNWCPGLKCDTWNASVGEGVTQLGKELTKVVRTAPADEDIIIFGYSQGGAVVSRAMYDIPEEQKGRITVVTIGNINNPQGLWSRLSFLRYIPILNVSFGPQLPTKGITSTNYSFEYDPVGDAPRYWGNPLAVANALFGFVYVHGYYLDPNSNGPDDALPYGYDDKSLADAIAAAPKREHGDATFVLIPQRGTLPIFMPLIEIGNETGTSAFIEPIVRLLQPVTKLLINLGYDRNADPGVARNLSILPFNPLTFNPVRFSIDFANAIAQGIHDAIHGSKIEVPAPAPANSGSDNARTADRFARISSVEQTSDSAEEATTPAAKDDIDELASATPDLEVTHEQDGADLAAQPADQNNDVAEDEEVVEDEAPQAEDVTTDKPEQEATDPVDADDEQPEGDESANTDTTQSDDGDHAEPQPATAPSEEKAAA